MHSCAWLMRETRSSQLVTGMADGKVKMCNMVVRGTIRLADGTTRTETMDIGHYMSQETLDALAAAYVLEDDDERDAALQAVIDRCLTEEYMPGNGPVELVDVESMTFPG
jgi:hypothetical protein